jgi:hypothetical protein
MNSLDADVLVAEALANESDDIEFGRSQRRPSAARPFAFTAPALGVRDHLGCGQRRSLSPSSVEVVASQFHTRSSGVLDVGAVVLEAHRAHPLPDSVCGTVPAFCARSSRRTEVVMIPFLVATALIGCRTTHPLMSSPGSRADVR